MNIVSEKTVEKWQVNVPRMPHRELFYVVKVSVMNYHSCCLLLVTAIAMNYHEPYVFHLDSPHAFTVAKASIGIIAGAVYISLAFYGFYLAGNLYTFSYDILKERLWLFNVLNGTVVIVSLCLFGAAGYLAKSSGVWFDESESSSLANLVLASNVILTIVSAFEICIGAAGVFMKS